MPLWATVLTIVFSGLAALSAVIGMFWHSRQSAKNSGRLEQKVDFVVEEMGRQRATVGQCQLADNCDRQMRAMGERLGSAHKRMDRQDERLDKHDDDIRDLSVKVAALKGKE